MGTSATASQSPGSVLDALLLQTQQHGDEEGLTSAAGLQELMHKVDVRKEEVLLTLFAIVAERFPPSSDGDAGGVAGPEELQAGADLSAALAALQDRGLAQDATQQLASLAVQHAALCAQLREAEVAAAAARVAAQLQQRLAALDEALAAGRWAEAAEGGVALRDALASDPGSGSEALAAVEVRLAPLQQRLLAAVPQLVRVDAATHLPAVAPPEGAAPADAAAGLLEVWRALAALGQLQTGLAALAELLLQSCVRPVLAEEAAAAVGGGSGGGAGAAASPAGSLASTTLSRATARGDGRRSVERQLYKLLKAVCEQLLGSSAELAAALGPLLWPELAAAYITLHLKPARPASDEEVEGFSRRAALGVKLEGKAAKLGLLPAAAAPGSPAAAAAAAADGPITRYVERTVGRFLSAKRGRFIQAARDLLASATAAQETAAVGATPPSGTPRAAAASRSLFGGSPSAAAGGGLEGEPSPLASGEYFVSKAAAGVATLMREALAEACCSGSAALAQAMCGAVVDVSATLLALPPGGGRGGEAAAGEAALLPYPAALRHNDLFYIHQTLCSLPYMYAPRLQQLVHRNVNFVNPANRLRMAADEALSAMVSRQAGELLAVVAEFGRFEGCGADASKLIRCRRAVVTLLAAFRRLGAALRGVLPATALVGVAAQLIQAVCLQIIDDIMSLQDIAVEDSEQIPRVLEDLTSGIHAAVLGSGGQRQEQGGQQGQLVGGVPLEALSAALEEATPAAWKLRELSELLDIRMVEIRQRWQARAHPGASAPPGARLQPPPPPPARPPAPAPADATDARPPYRPPQEGRLPALGFSADEVAHLLCALFEDTDLRRDFLAALEGQELL